MAAVVVTTPSERQYHNTNSAYVLPNDATEQRRLDAQAAAITEMIGGGPFLALDHAAGQPSKAVDIGCGTGVATMQIANLFPSAQVYGVDISPVPEMTQRMAPSNASWVLGDVLNANAAGSDEAAEIDRVFAPNSLDYIFGRMLFLGISDWKKYFQTTASSMASGAVIEHQDLDWKFYRVGTSECLSDAWEWHNQVCQAAEKSGLSTTAGTQAAQLMREQGLEILSVRTFEFSFSPSAKTPDSQALGKYVQAKLLPNYPELLRKMLGSKGIEGELLDRYTKECLRDFSAEEGIHQKYTVTIARKP